MTVDNKMRRKKNREKEEKDVGNFAKPAGG